MKILSAEFVTSAASGGSASGIPRDGLVQFAFAGRSNVGKSSLLNALTRQKVARTSAAPGKTRLANIFRVTAEGGPGGPGRWSCYFVDLPGYGYARGGGDAAQELAAVAETYFGVGQRLRPERAAGQPPPRLRRPAEASAEAGGKPGAAGPASESAWGWGPARSEKSRPSAGAIRAVFLLVDSRHPGLKSDIQAHRWLSEMAGPPIVVATKVDKLSRAERTRNLRELERMFGTAAEPVSATSGEGLDELWRTIANLARGIGADDGTEAEDASRR